MAPQEVEAVLARHPKIADVGCSELRVRDDLSVIAAYVVPLSLEALPDREEIMSFAASRLAPYKCPREIVLVEGLPRTANGKLLRRALGTAPRVHEHEA